MGDAMPDRLFWAADAGEDSEPPGEDSTVDSAADPARASGGTLRH
jgi:hypothetical protein